MKHLLLAALLLVGARPARAHVERKWLEQAVDSVWQNPSNWDGEVPNDNMEVATFETSNVTAVTLSSPILIQAINFHFAPSYTFSGAMLAFDLYENPSAFGILVPEVDSQIVFQNPVHLFASSGSSPEAFLQLDASTSLAFAGGLTIDGLGLFLVGRSGNVPAIVFFNGPAPGDIAGSVTVNPLADLGGDGTIKAPVVQIEGGLRPGASKTGPPGALTIESALTLGNRSLAFFDLGGDVPPLHDRVIGISTLAFSGTLHLRGTNGFNTAAMQAGDTFDLFDWSGQPATENGFGFGLDSTLAPLANGLLWEVSNLLTHGTVHVAPALPNLAIGGTATASAGTTAPNAFDGNNSTAWTNGTSGGATGWLQYRFANGTRQVVNRYALISSADSAARDPRDWALEASNDGVNWTTLGVIGNRAGIVFAQRGGMKLCVVENTSAYEFYRLSVSANNGGAGLSLAELSLHYSPPAAAVEVKHLHAPEITKSGNTVTIRALSVFGRLYYLSRRGDPALGPGEKRVPAKTGTGNVLTFTDTVPPNEPAQFYRLEIAP